MLRKNFPGSNIEGYNEKDFRRVIKGEIRQTYFHSIETLFELIFALEPQGGSIVF